MRHIAKREKKWKSITYQTIQTLEQHITAMNTQNTRAEWSLHKHHLYAQNAIVHAKKSRWKGICLWWRPGWGCCPWSDDWRWGVSCRCVWLIGAEVRRMGMWTPTDHWLEITIETPGALGRGCSSISTGKQRAFSLYLSVWKLFTLQSQRLHVSRL